MTSENYLAEIHRAIGRIEGKLDEMTIARAAESIIVAEHGKSIVELKNRQHWYAGVMGAVGAMLGFGGTHFLKS